jgi:hypothetical protein
VLKIDLIGRKCSIKEKSSWKETRIKSGGISGEVYEREVEVTFESL